MLTLKDFYFQPFLKIQMSLYFNVLVKAMFGCHTNCHQATTKCASVKDYKTVDWVCSFQACHVMHISRNLGEKKEEKSHSLYLK